jgi:hypothetical protein
MHYVICSSIGSDRRNRKRDSNHEFESYLDEFEKSLGPKPDSSGGYEDMKYISM